MVNFRFHVVSIIAIFLAIAIGTVMGATFVGRGVIDRLQIRIDTVQSNADEARGINAELEQQLGQVSRYVDQTADYAVGRSLDDVRIDVIAERGVDGGTVDAQAALLRTAGAIVPGVVWLEEPWNLAEEEQADALREATGLTNRNSIRLRLAAAGVLGRRLAAPAPLPADDVLVKLADAGFVTLSEVVGGATPTAADFAGDTARTLVIGGPDSAIPVGTTLALSGGLVDGEAKVAIGEIFVETAEATDRSTWIDALADADALRNRVSTIDDVDRVEGRVAAALALAELGTGAFGNYGLEQDRAVPENVLTVPTTTTIPATPTAR